MDHSLVKTLVTGTPTRAEDAIPVDVSILHPTSQRPVDYPDGNPVGPFPDGHPGRPTRGN